MKTIIIGAGAAGISAAIKLKRKGIDVLVIEKNKTSLKKLSITGAGKCNFFNKDISIRRYYSESEELLPFFINMENIERAYSFFDSLGIIYKDVNGYMYPYSLSALSFKNILLTEARILSIDIKLEEEVLSINRNEKSIVTDKGSYSYDKLIIACGSSASLNSPLSKMLRSFAKENEIKYIDELPALSPLILKDNTEELSGIRVRGVLSHYENNLFIREEEGEIQFTDYGISGICTMNLSAKIARGLSNFKKETIYINFFPVYNLDTGYTFLEERNEALPNRTIIELLESAVNYKILAYLLKKSKIDTTACWDNISKERKEKFCSNLWNFRAEVKEVKEMKYAQVASGGFSLRELNANFSLKKDTNIFVIGEATDICGDCGGYNLGFAFISALKVGEVI